MTKITMKKDAELVKNWMIQHEGWEWSTVKREMYLNGWDIFEACHYLSLINGVDVAWEK